MKLTNKQKEVLILMNSGWQLGLNTSSFSSRSWWIQEGGCGKGGKVINYDKRNNISKLSSLELIKSEGFCFPAQTYYLTDKGKNLLTQIQKDEK